MRSSGPRRARACSASAFVSPEIPACSANTSERSLAICRARGSSTTAEASWAIGATKDRRGSAGALSLRHPPREQELHSYNRSVTGAEHLFRGCGIPPELVRTQPLVWTVTVCPAGTDTMILRSLSMVTMASPEHSPSAGRRLGDLGVSFDELVQRDDLDGPGLSPAPGHGGISPPLGRRNGLGALRGNGAESELTTAGTS